MNEYDEMKMAALADIAIHLSVHGKENWAETRDKYPKISDRTWWRMVKQVSEGKPTAQIMRKAVKQAREAMLMNLPAPVPPEYLAKGGVKAVANIDIIAIFGRMMMDVDLLREYSITHEDDGAGGKTTKIKNPVFFAKNINITRDLVETFLRAMDQVYNHKRNQDFYDAIVSVISEESPDAGRKIMERLQELNDETGMTINARI